MSDLHSINNEQRLFVIKNGSGFSCLGFDVCEKRRLAYCVWLYGPKGHTHDIPVGTIESYNAYLAALESVRERCAKTREKCPAELEPLLTGLEGKRVEVTAPDGSRERFYVGKSTGHLPIHLAIKTRRSSGGCQAYIPRGAQIRVVGSR